MGKSDFAYAKRCGYRAADQSLCFCYVDSTIPLICKSEIKPLAVFYGCTTWFALDLVGNL